MGPNNKAVHDYEEFLKHSSFDVRQSGLLPVSVTKKERKVETRKLTFLVFVRHQLKADFAQQRWQNNCQLAADSNLLLFQFHKKLHVFTVIITASHTVDIK